MSNIIVVTAIVYVQSAQLTLFVLKKTNEKKNPQYYPSYKTQGWGEVTLTEIKQAAH